MSELSLLNQDNFNLLFRNPKRAHLIEKRIAANVGIQEILKEISAADLQKNTKSTKICSSQIGIFARLVPDNVSEREPHGHYTASPAA